MRQFMRTAYICPNVLDDLKPAEINRIIQNDREKNDLASENFDVRNLHAVYDRSRRSLLLEN